MIGIQKEIHFVFDGTDKKIDIEDADFNKIVRCNSEYISVTGGSNNIITIDPKFFSEDKKVPNIIRYKLIYQKNTWVLSRANGADLGDFDSECKKGVVLDNTKKADNCIFLILESPHRDEYDGSMNPRTPAFKRTGANFHNCFIPNALPNLINNGLNLDCKVEYNLCLVNPVPFQASLWNLYSSKLLKNVRNKIWKVLFEETEKDFLNLINFHRPVHVFNACTQELALEIESFLIGNNINNIFCKKIYHPSSYHFKTPTVY